MLTHIVDPHYFDICIEAVKHAYYPYDKCFNRQKLKAVNGEKTFDDLDQFKEYIRDLLTGFENNQSGSNKITTIRDIIKESVDTQSLEKKFYLVVNDKNSFKKGLRLPFMKHFHEWFLLRKWDEAYRDPQQQVNNLLRLHPGDLRLSNVLIKFWQFLIMRNCLAGILFLCESPASLNRQDNHSKNHGNFNHFVNVVAALARLIWYFRDPKTVYESLFGSLFGKAQTEKKSLCQTIAYGDGTDTKISPRTFKLMLAAFYHDIGKTIIAPRHAMEGAIILASHTTLGRYQFAEILKAYNKIPAFDKEEFNWDDLLIVADFVLYHDQYGTLSTGEDSYIQLAEIIDKLSRYSLKASQKQSSNLSQKQLSQQYLFDLWLLNIADIIVSLERKTELQDDWWGDKDQAEVKFDNFFKEDKAADLIHDLKISLNLLDNYLNKKHISTLISSGEDAHAISVRHAIERLRRLIVTSLGRAFKECEDEKKDELRAIIPTIEKFSEEEWNLMIVLAIESITDRNEYCNRFSWIGKSDYALGFFTKLATAALKTVAQEIKGSGLSTGWIHRESGAKNNEQDYKDYLKTNNAQLFATNYVAIVIKIIEHLIFREPSLDRPRNLEFSDATERLQEDKINQILGFEGSFRSRYSTYLILQTIYLY